MLIGRLAMKNSFVLSAAQYVLKETETVMKV